MEAMTENFDYHVGDSEENAIVVFVKDREVKCEERWVVASLSLSEAETLCEFLQEALK